MPTKTCQYCNNAFQATHRNQKYCPNTDCALSAKLNRQSKNYEIGDDAKKAIQRNHKVFTDLLGDKPTGEFELLNLLNYRFDQNGYFGYGENKSNKKRFYIVHDFFFHITSENPQKIQIWKQSKK